MGRQPIIFHVLSRTFSSNPRSTACRSGVRPAIRSASIRADSTPIARRGVAIVVRPTMFHSALPRTIPYAASGARVR